MTSVGIRELKAHLSRYLRSINGGEEIVVTDRGRPIARIVSEPRGKQSPINHLRRLEEQGLLVPPERPLRRKVAGLARVGGKRLSEVVIEERR